MLKDYEEVLFVTDQPWAIGPVFGGLIERKFQWETSADFEALNKSEIDDDTVIIVKKDAYHVAPSKTTMPEFSVLQLDSYRLYFKQTLEARVPIETDS